MDSLAFLDRATRASPEPIYVLHGDEDFLKRQVLAGIRKRSLEAESDSFGLSFYSGDKITFAEIRDELETLPFAGSRRLVVVEGADPFVTAARTLLEKYFSQPAATGTLVLDVKTWRSDTKLAKLLKDNATIVCKAIPAYRLPSWCVKWMAAQHGKRLSPDAADLLVELVGTDMGQLDQEMCKLAIYVGSANQVDAKDVDKIIGRGRVENMWKIFDAIGSGQTGTALAILDRLFEQGEEPLRILGAFSMQLRRLAQVARRSRQGQPLVRAMSEAGVPHFAQKGCELQLKHLGQERAEQLYDWLLEVDVSLKSTTHLPARTLLERLVVRLARPL
jgi:DNA polymerase III subunit delta